MCIAIHVARWDTLSECAGPDKAIIITNDFKCPVKEAASYAKGSLRIVPISRAINSISGDNVVQTRFENTDQILVYQIGFLQVSERRIDLALSRSENADKTNEH